MFTAPVICSKNRIYLTSFMLLLSFTVTIITLGYLNSERVIPYKFQARFRIHNLTSERRREYWIVVTSVSSPTKDIEKLADLDGWQLLVVGDTKTPTDWNYPGSIYIGIEEQHKLGYRIVQHLPFGSYTRKNIGYLYAIEHGARFIYDTDDDNHPTDNLTRFKKSPYTTGIIYEAVKGQVMNPYAHFGQPSIWPRGYPLDLIAESSTNSYVSCQFKTPPVQQGLVGGDPDVDAIFRLTRKKIGKELNLTFDAHAPPVTLPPGVFAPYNSQNTFHSYRGLWSLMLPTTVAFRVTDIWRGYWAQRLLWLIGDVMAFHPPNAYQKRNSHSYFKDFLDEEAVYEDSGAFVKYLSTWNCKSPMTFFQCVSKLSHDMVIEGFWKKADADLTDAWLADLIDIGYKEPVIVNYDVDTATDSCIKSNLPNKLLFYPVTQTTSILTPSLYDGQALQPRLDSLLSLCPTLLDNYPQKDPSYTFNNILLVVVFNHPHLHIIPLLDEIFSNHFPNTIYCANVNSTDWSFLYRNFNINNPESKSRRLSFINSTLSKGYLGYECTAQAIEMGYNVDGYLAVGDDVLFNFWNMKSLNTSQVFIQSNSYRTRDRYSNETKWIWWNHKDIGKIGTNNLLDEVSDFEHLKGSSYEDNVNAARNIAIEEFMKNRNEKGFNMTTISIALSDIYFIPNHVAHIFYHAASLFRKHKVFLEIAVPTTIDGLQPTNWATVTGYNKWNIGPNILNYYNSSKTYLHPVKLGLLQKDANFTADFCQKYVTDLFQNW